MDSGSITEEKRRHKGRHKSAAASSILKAATTLIIQSTIVDEATTCEAADTHSCLNLIRRTPTLSPSFCLLLCPLLRLIHQSIKSLHFPSSQSLDRSLHRIQEIDSLRCLVHCRGNLTCPEVGRRRRQRPNVVKVNNLVASHRCHQHRNEIFHKPVAQAPRKREPVPKVTDGGQQPSAVAIRGTNGAPAFSATRAFTSTSFQIGQKRQRKRCCRGCCRSRKAQKKHSLQRRLAEPEQAGKEEAATEAAAELTKRRRIANPCGKPKVCRWTETSGTEGRLVAKSLVSTSLKHRSESSRTRSGRRKNRFYEGRQQPQEQASTSRSRRCPFGIPTQSVSQVNSASSVRASVCPQLDPHIINSRSSNQRLTIRRRQTSADADADADISSAPLKSHIPEKRGFHTYRDPSPIPSASSDSVIQSPFRATTCRPNSRSASTPDVYTRERFQLDAIIFNLIWDIAGGSST